MIVLRNGSKGQAVGDLQRKLNQVIGSKLTVDNWFGDATAEAVAAYQKSVGLVDDGVVGKKTWESLNSNGKPSKLIGMADLQAAAVKLGVPIASIRAVSSVESRGEGFLQDGRPVILFERQWFYKRLKAAGANAAALAQRYPSLCNPNRGGYAGGPAEWQRFKTASSLDAKAPAAAIEACSWGVFQIMGFHWKTLGYASAQDYADRMAVSEGEQLDAFVRFILADKALHTALKQRRWAAFARSYNGPAYKENLYDTKLARAYERYSKAGAA